MLFEGTLFYPVVGALPVFISFSSRLLIEVLEVNLSVLSFLKLSSVNGTFGEEVQCL